jgi:serine/threonine protein kinase
MRHENILCLYASYEYPQRSLLMVEFCGGGHLSDEISRRGKTVSGEEAATWMKQILSAIQVLHLKDVCHRDIKPDNFLISRKNPSPVVKLTGFGLAVPLPKGESLTERCGTQDFMAPELLPGRKCVYDHSVDIWAAGTIMFLLLQDGRHPFYNQNDRLDENLVANGAPRFASASVWAMSFQGNSSRSAENLCMKMLETQPQMRISADQALQDPWLMLAPTRIMLQYGKKGQDVAANSSDAPLGIHANSVAVAVRPKADSVWSNLFAGCSLQASDISAVDTPDGLIPTSTFQPSAKFMKRVRAVSNYSGPSFSSEDNKVKNNNRQDTRKSLKSLLTKEEKKLVARPQALDQVPKHWNCQGRRRSLTCDGLG